MVTGYEVQMYRDIERIARALERIADVLEAQEERAGEGDRPDPRTSHHR